jgi:hypothetical protein
MWRSTSWPQGAEVDPLPAIEADIPMIERERDRLVAAVAAGSLDALVAALRQREAPLKRLRPGAQTPRSAAPDPCK